MHRAQRRHRHHLEVLVRVHVAQRHQRAVFGVQRGGVVRQRLHAHLVGHLGQHTAQRRVAGAFERQVGDEVRQLVAGVHALEVRRAVDVVVGVDQPVRVEHHQRVHARLAAAAPDLLVPFDRIAPRAVARPGQLAEVHRRHVRDLGGQRNLAHVQTPQCGMWWEPYDTGDILGLEEDLVAPGAAFTAGAAGLGAAEGLAQIAHVLAVDEAHAGFHRRGHAVRTAQVLGPHVAGQAVGDVVGLDDGVGLVDEGDQAGHGAEDLFLRDAHAVVHVGEDRRPHEIAALQVCRQVRRIQPAGDQRGAFLRAQLDVAAHLGQVLRADHRADDRALVQRVADGDLRGARREALHEVGVDGLVYQDAAARGATLAVVAEDHEDRGIERAVEVGVLEDDERALAAELHAELLQPRGADDAVCR